MKFKIHVISFVFFFSCLSVHVVGENNTTRIHNPGFMGKKNTISFYYSPHFRVIPKFLFENQISDLARSKIKHHFGVAYERTLYKWLSANFNYYGMSKETRYAGFGESVVDRNGTESFFFNHAISARSALNSFQGGLKFYFLSKGSIAPLGNYFHLFYGSRRYNLSNVQVYEYDLVAPDNNAFNENAKIQNHDDQLDYKHSFLGIGLGKTRIIKNKFIFGIEGRGQINLNPNSVFNNLEGYSSNNTDVFESHANSLMAQSRITINFSAGYLF